MDFGMWLQLMLIFKIHQDLSEEGMHPLAKWATINVVCVCYLYNNHLNV